MTARWSRSLSLSLSLSLYLMARAKEPRSVAAVAGRQALAHSRYRS